MSIDALLLLRNSMRDDIELSEYWQAQYHKESKYFLGYRSPPSAHDYPSVCFVPVRTLRKIDRDELLISLIVSVHEPDIVDDVFKGVSSLQAVQLLIVNFLRQFDVSGCFVEGDIKLTTDLGKQHPFWEMEIMFNLVYRPDLIEEDGDVAKVLTFDLNNEVTVVVQ